MLYLSLHHGDNLRPAISHAAHAWHQPDTDKGRGTTPTRKATEDPE